jgi:glucose-1-phosphate thymidylyltransferase
MKAIVLAAGYATRLFPLTTNFPKPLLPINHRPMIDYIIEKIEEIWISDIIVVANDKYFVHLQVWAQTYTGNANIKVINDETTTNDTRLGAIWTIQYVVEKAHIADDILVVGGDNLFKFSLQPSYELFKRKQKTTIIGYDVKSKDLAKKYGIIDIDADNKVLNFVEKPETPPSTLAAICLYYYPEHILPEIKKYLDEGKANLTPEKYNKRKDAPGNLPSWLLDKDGVYAQVHDEHRYDVGGFESLKAAREDFGETEIDLEGLKKGVY